MQGNILSTPVQGCTRIKLCSNLVTAIFSLHSLRTTFQLYGNVPFLFLACFGFFIGANIDLMLTNQQWLFWNGLCFVFWSKIIPDSSMKSKNSILLSRFSTTIKKKLQFKQKQKYFVFHFTYPCEKELGLHNMLLKSTYYGK